MSIKKSFNGVNIRKPGPYSKFTVDNSSGTLSANDTIMLVGESTKGAPGSATGIQSFTSDQIGSLIAMFGSGPIVDCALAAIRPSKQNNVGGSGAIKVWKTNASTQASGLVKKSTSTIINVADLGWGVAGNALSVIVGAGSGNSKVLSVSQVGGTTESLGATPGIDTMTVIYAGNGSAASLTITGSNRNAMTLAIALTAASDGSASLSIPLAGLSIKSLVDTINTHQGYTASLSSLSSGPLPAASLDPVSAVSALSSVTLRRLQAEIVDVLNTSSRISASLATTPVVGVPDNGTSALSGGAQGASVNADFANGFAASLGEDYNVLLACVSRDASEDIADTVQGFTDAASTYDIASVQAAQTTHLILRGSTKNRKEAQGFCGIRKSTKAAAYAAAQTIGSELMQACIEDVLVNDVSGSNRWMHPHVTAAIAAGMRTGVAVGEPLTHKYANIQAKGHKVNPATGISAGDFNSDLDYDVAIDAGILFLDKVSGGFRWCVDCTTFGADQSFVNNRGSVVEAVQYVNKYIRDRADQLFVGAKVSNGAAKSLASAISGWFKELNAANVNIVTSSDGAPDGFDPTSLVVTITGNTAQVSVRYIPVQGLDFVLFSFVIGDIKQSA